ncbi:MAG: serine protease [Actinomycetota bacterium]|nr:serine protease [Actinomycetota bacterium]
MRQCIRRKLVVVGLLTVVATTMTPTAPALAIYNGYSAPISSHRFMVSLRRADNPTRHTCGGTLIAADIVLTAAHCVAGAGQDGLVALVGVDEPAWAAAPRIRSVAYRIPVSYNPANDRDDIAVVRLAVAQTSPTVRLATTEPPVNARVEAAGWGCTDRPLIATACSGHPKNLQGSRQTVIADRLCGRDVFFNPPSWAPTSICTAGVNTSTNRGDSGGPLLVGDARGGFVQAGVVALGSDNPAKFYGEFTSIPAEAQWIAGAITALHAAGYPTAFVTDRPLTDVRTALGDVLGVVAGVGNYLQFEGRRLAV